ncbi:DUF4189 domain-containing protein [Gemmobacter caeruleus]|uniref:DUF4189 domain-containing protein n=1 Tax=Gemmobacter caeruleus TaxID=2595004 RepID=UPI0011F01A71|nr:DUF4189 domain-containing protein [Gemmobacter caeruleus]
MIRATLVLLVLAAALPASAQEVLRGKAAQRLMFKPEGSRLEIVAKGGLSEANLSALSMVGKDQPYYGAIAISPDEGLMVDATVAAVNYHGTEAAEAAALKGCEAARKGKAACLVIGLIRPDGWEPRALQLSQDATRALRGDYKAPGALAISATTGHFGLGADAGAAVAACEAGAKPGDCRVVVQD